MNSFAQSLPFIGLTAFILLLPFGRLSELGVLMCMISSALCLASGRMFQNFNKPALCAALACWVAIFAAELISCVDSMAVNVSLVATFGSIRFATLILAATQLSSTQRILVGKIVAAVLGFWCADALVQATCGFSVGGHSYSDRISGVFGNDNLKLGLVTATLVPIALFFAQQLNPFGLRAASSAVSPRQRDLCKGAVLVAIWLIFATVILLAGARAGWVMFALVSVLWGLRLGNYNLRKVGLGLLLGVIATTCLAAILNATSSRFALRVERTMAIFNLKTADFALAGRVPIWETAANMAVAHPVNGVGVRAFRYAYPEFAAPSDPWLHTEPTENGGETTTLGANHPHQLLLEILTETGLIGLALWAFAVFALVRAWRLANQLQRDNAWPYGCALIVLTFPINTHTAMYSSFWAGVVWWLVAMLTANLDAVDESAP